MFAKLLKYEFKSTSKTLTAASIAALIAGALGGLLMYLICDGYVFDNLEVLFTVAIILLGGIMIGLFVYMIGCIYMLYARFYKTKFCDEGYLTFTVPASTHQILLSSILNIFIWLCIICLVFALSYGMIFLGISGLHLDIESIFDMQELISIDLIDTPQMILSIISSTVYSLILPLISLTIGCLVAKKHKILCSFAIGYGISMAVSIFSGVITATSYLQSSSGVALFEPLTNIVYLEAWIQLALGLGGYFLMHYLIQKQLNI